MGGGGSAPPAQPDPNKLAEQARMRATALSQMYAQRSGYMGTEGTILGGKSHTALGDLGVPTVGELEAMKGKSSKVHFSLGKTTAAASSSPALDNPYANDKQYGKAKDRKGLADAFNDWNMAMAYYSQKRKGQI